MSTVGASEVTQLPSTSAQKNKKHKRKKPVSKPKINGTTEKTNGNYPEVDDGLEAEEHEEPETPTDPIPTQAYPEEALQNGIKSLAINGTITLPGESTGSEASAEEESTAAIRSPRLQSRRTTITKESLNENAPIHNHEDNDTQARLNALAKERATLRDEVTELRKSLEEIQLKHNAELGTMKDQLEDTQNEKDHAETQYRNLLGKVNTIRSQLGERLKADAEDLAQARSHIEDLEEQNRTLQNQDLARKAELAKLAEEGEEQSKELSSLRNRLNLSQQNWSKEREDLLQRESYVKREFESARQAMQDWEVLAMEERSIRESLAERVSDLEDQVTNHREAYETAASERDSQSLTVDGLQRALQEIQEARKLELREVVENSQAQLEELRRQLEEAQKKSAESTSALKSAKSELDRALPFENEVKEKNLLIGKLRHEAVILNDHLTKALRQLKRGKQDDNIDKQLISNHFLHFLALERSDPRKFQILQIISALLGWTDEQREQAGLARPGASNPSLRTPISPWHRTPSTPALSADSFQEGRGRRESLAGLWSDFLEQGAEEGARSSRSTSISSAVRHP
ncbi:hypothetical protein MMC26_002697 [Xylographa opegraphella]|nr:hypothetical protein [Xylographa opegraphella]